MTSLQFFVIEIRTCDRKHITSLLVETRFTARGLKTVGGGGGGGGYYLHKSERKK